MAATSCSLFLRHANTQIETKMKSFISSTARTGVDVAAPVFERGCGLTPRYVPFDDALVSQPWTERPDACGRAQNTDNATNEVQQDAKCAVRGGQQDCQVHGIKFDSMSAQVAVVAYWIKESIRTSLV